MSEITFTFFTSEKREVLLPSLIDRGYKPQKNGSILYADAHSRIEIIPFSKEGRLEQGYRLKYQGSVETLAFVLDRTFSRYDIKVVAAEWQHQSSYSQEKLVSLAHISGFAPSSSYGLFDFKGVGVVITKNSQIHFIYRNREGIEPSRLLRIANYYNTLGTKFHVEIMDIGVETGVAV